MQQLLVFQGVIFRLMSFNVGITHILLLSGKTIAALTICLVVTAGCTTPQPWLCLMKAVLGDGRRSNNGSQRLETFIALHVSTTWIRSIMLPLCVCVFLFCFLAEGWLLTKPHHPLFYDFRTKAWGIVCAHTPRARFWFLARFSSNMSWRCDWRFLAVS